MTWTKPSGALRITLLLWLSSAISPVLAGVNAKHIEDHRADVKIEEEKEIVPAGTVSRAMMSMVRHPDGTVFLNAQATPPKLFKSSDQGQTWTAVPLNLPHVPPNQVTHGLGVNRKGRLFLVHQTPAGQGPNQQPLYGQDLFVSYSDDGGRTWEASQTDFRRFPPGIPNMMFHEDGNRTFIEQPDGTLMFTTTIVPAPDYSKKYPAAPGMYGGKPGDLFSDVIFRSADGGRTWGSPIQVYPSLNPHESALAIDPNDAKHILLMTRCQRPLLPEEDAKEFMRKTGNPRPYIKQGVLFESTDGGQTFRQAEGGMTGWYGHRGAVLWTQNGHVVVTHQDSDGRLLARISLDGGRTWVDGTKTGTRLMNKSTKFVLAPSHSFTSPTVELSRDHFLTVYCTGGFAIRGVFWHLDSP